LGIELELKTIFSLIVTDGQLVNVHVLILGNMGDATKP
jgi:hypothetical protein